jgi:two-component system response regulator LytT
MDLRAVVVDDEQLAREEMCFQLERVGGVDVVGQAGNGVEAVKVIEHSEPDLVLLDVQMPGLTGFEVARRLVDRRVDAHIVFVTAFDQYALEAFEVNAVDYLLKPVEPRRLEQAIDRVRRRVSAPGDGGRGRADDRRGKGSLGHDDLERLLQLVAERKDRQEQLAVKVAERFLLIASHEIVHASVENDGITVVTGTIVGTSNYRTLDELQARLDPEVFWRVHRSHLVNIQKIKEIVPWFSRNYILKMKDAKGSEIPVSRAQTRRLREYLRL